MDHEQSIEALAGREIKFEFSHLDAIIVEEILGKIMIKTLYLVFCIGSGGLESTCRLFYDCRRFLIVVKNDKKE